MKNEVLLHQLIMLTNKKKKGKKHFLYGYKYGQTDQKAALETTHSDLSLLFSLLILLLMEPKVVNNNPKMLEKPWLSTALNARSLGLGTETIVFAHGFGTDQSVWDKIIPLLAEDYKVVLFDWPFSGAVDPSLYDPLKYSSMEAFADVLITLMDQMDLKAVNFVGHSMAGMIGCIASIARPDLFKRLILLGASPRSSSFSLTFSYSVFHKKISSLIRDQLFFINISLFACPFTMFF